MEAEAVETFFCGVNPILRVRDLAVSLRYYIEKLGFKESWKTPYMACVARGKAHLFLVPGDQGHLGGWVWIGVEGDVEQIYREYVASGATIRQGLTNFEWALEMQVYDPDRNVLRIGGEPREDEPYGPWLDMNGVRWLWAGQDSSCGGVWTREVTQATTL
jgi:catechol 2,3-dioxygenase-like lactoylglutathione lyase family enzyme